MTKEEAIEIGHQLSLYEDSEKSDVENQDLDHLWQSLYDICQLASYGILEDVEQEELDEVLHWLKQSQPLTKDYKETEIYF